MGNPFSLRYLTPAVVAAFESINPLDVIHLDAHLDYMDAVHTVRYVGGTLFVGWLSTLL
jgi:arginase family enzyme